MRVCGLANIGRQHKIERACVSLLELDEHVLVTLFETDDLVAEHRFRSGADFFEDQP